MTKNFLLVLILYSSFNLISCRRQMVYLADTKVSYYRIDKKLKDSDKQTDSLIGLYKAKLDQEMNIVIGQCEAELVKGKPSSTLTNFFADAFADGCKHVVKTDIDFAISNYGGIRINALAKGDITLGKVYELMPFDNLLAIAEADSAGVHLLCNRIASNGGWPVSEELNFVIVDSMASNITVKGHSLSSAKKYRFALPDYVANGGDDCYFLKNYSIEFTQHMIRDVLIEEIKRRKLILENNSERIKKVENGK